MSAVPPPAQLGADQPIEVVLVAAMAHGASGRVEARDGKKRWQFFFADGALVETRSNLKSEHPDTIRAKKPGMSDAGVLKNCALLRMRNAMKAGRPGAFAEGVEAKQPGEIAAMGLLLRAVASQRSVEEIRARLDAEDDATLTVSGDLGALSFSGAVAAGAATWDGSTLAAALGAGSARPAERAAALWVAVAMGAVQTGAAEGAEAAEHEPAAPTLDIASLLDGLGDSSPPAEDAPTEQDDGRQGSEWAPDKVLLPPEGAPKVAAPPSDRPSDFEDAEIQAIGDDGPVTLDASFFEALNQRPDRETVRAAGFVHTSAAAEPEAEPEPEVDKHPMEDELRALAERLSTTDDHFGVLDVPWDAGGEAFRKAHLELAQKLHPDRYSDAPEALQDLATETFDKVRAAWEVLGDDAARGAYIDRVIHGKKTEDELAMEQVENYWAAEADFKRGLAAFNAGRIRESHDLFASAVEREANELEFRAYLGFTTFQLNKTGDPEAADRGKEMLKDVLERNKEQDRKLDAAWVLMGRIFRDQSNDKGAKRCFRQALKLNPSNSDAVREMRRLTGGGPGRKKEPEKKKTGGFFSRWFGGGKK